ncbi:MAG TPA: ATP-dependent Clp protease proteolytic subunit [Acidimicrobiales bacterium]|nr:ATP-dependent Clp protease proteolytic subunit [Acidimicrobiales bacterium]
MAAEPPLGGAVGIDAALLARRVVMVHGELDDDQVTRTAAALMALDALGDDHVELRLHAPRGSVDAALVLVDVVEVLGVPVHTTAMGLVGGGAVALLAAGAVRRMSPHARLHLHEPDTAVAGWAGDIERALAERAARRDDFFAFLARRTGRPAAEITEEWSRGRFLEPADAVTLGYADDVVTGR